MTFEYNVPYDDPDLPEAFKKLAQDKIFRITKDRRQAIRDQAERGKIKYVQKFIDDTCIIGPDEWAPLPELYNAFLKWHEGVTLPRSPESKILFSKYLQRLGYPKKSGRYLTKFKGVYFIFIGLKKN